MAIEVFTCIWGTLRMGLYLSVDIIILVGLVVLETVKDRSIFRRKVADHVY